ncbi:uncharacterized protein LOC126278172 [Schistocerca gregaria]|uniref:uncharacterized protein LOC126278172 n=1 Tax=Schistocerca gregaria TaxID=7010 RepID=UPI00211E09D5|nr:uncharacterized protein LOC126278172 [Schistocerca gregaria]
MSNDFFSLRDLRTSRSKNFLDADDIPVLTFEDSLDTGSGYHSWRHHNSGGSSSPEDHFDHHRPQAAGKPRKVPRPHTKQGHSSIEDFFAKRDRRKNRKAAGRLVPAEVARRILEINARQSAGDAPLEGEGALEPEAGSAGQAPGQVPTNEVADDSLQVVKPPPEGWEHEADGDGECVNDGSWFGAELPQSSRMQEELQVSWEEGYLALQTRSTGAYLPPQLRQRQSERARVSERRSLGGLQSAGGGEASAPDIGCLQAFPALGSGGGSAAGGSGGGWGCRIPR